MEACGRKRSRSARTRPRPFDKHKNIQHTCVIREFKKASDCTFVGPVFLEFLVLASSEFESANKNAEFCFLICSASSSAGDNDKASVVT